MIPYTKKHFNIIKYGSKENARKANKMCEITNKILKLTQSIRNNSENELCFGTLRTLAMIDGEAKLIPHLL